ncbi:hypothetical protein CFB46_08835 [Burkholderia sp. HI2761]|nr:MULTISPECIES: hypothetical protein [unclassified Burkholderia]MPV58553.1 hypothetical protein [Burkholderia sp. BE24]OXJ26885.1 hypothetical protein CFB46_08835 [Burkholderia sp. HI2761]
MVAVKSLAALSAAGAHDAPGAAFDARHRSWGAWGGGAHVVVAQSDDARSTLSAPVAVNALPEPIYTSAETRPKRATSPDGRAGYVSWSTPLDAGWRGEMSHPVWIGRDGVREARSGLPTADVLDGWLRHAKR